jgi:hypothetical protein
MRLVRSVASVTVLVLAASGTGLAQQTTQQGPRPVPQRGYISANAGAVTAPPTAAGFGVEYGDNVHRNAQAYVSLSYFENLMGQDLRDELVTLGQNLSSTTGTPWQFSGRDRGVSLTTGGKYLVGNGSVRPYVGGGAGVLSLRRTVSEARQGNVTAAVFNDFTVGDRELASAPASLTRPMVEAIFGVGIVKGSTYVDVGYRYRRAFRLAESLDFSQFGAGIGFKF